MTVNWRSAFLRLPWPEITEYLETYNVDICCLQKTDIPFDYPEEILNSGSYILELELNDEKNVLEFMLRRMLNTGGGVTSREKIITLLLLMLKMLSQPEFLISAFENIFML